MRLSTHSILKILTCNVHSFDTYFYQNNLKYLTADRVQQGFNPENRLGYMRYEIFVGQDDYSLDCGDDANQRTDDLCFDLDGEATI